MNNYLQGLPFNAGQGNSSDCDCEGQAFDPAKFKLYTQADRLPTFVLRLPPYGNNPDITYAGECLRIFTCDTKNMIANLTQEESGYKLLKDLNSYYLTYDGSAISGLNMECGKCYRIKIMSYWSEPFWVTDIPQSKITLEFTNKSQLGDVPYQTPLNFVNRIVIDGEICGMDAELFENKKTDAAGKESITFQMLTERKQLFIYNAPEFIQKLIKSIPLHDKFVLTHKGETITPLFKRSDPSSTKNGCCDYDLTITMPLRDLKNIGGKCDSDTEGVLTVVDIPEDMPDTCEIDDDFLPTSETICLEFNKVPPPIIPPITPVGTPPVGAPCPPAGFPISRNSITVDCANAFLFEGVKYKKKITKVTAVGDCTTTEQVQYLEPCQFSDASHTVISAICGNVIIVPPPPVGSPPVGTPPGTPPVGSPPVTSPASFTAWNVGGWSGEVWRPENYTTQKTYSVIYVHDGVTLYAKNGHPDGNWNLDQRIQSLITSGLIRDSIVVSVNTPDRMRTLLPNKPFYTMSGGDQATISSNNGGGPRGDETLNFMVSQLKPYIDGAYSTKTDRLNTTIMGASMGGLFAIYAYGERSDIFGKMAALSPHYQGTLNNVNDNLLTDDVVNYISTFFPAASTGGSLYFDRGTTSLDENYATPQNQVNTILANKGYTSSNLKTVVFTGGGHTPTEWGEHVPGIFSFLLPATISPVGTPPVGTPPVLAKGAKYITMNLTGEGWRTDTSTGMSQEWVDRIEAFRNLSWNGQTFSGIQGIQVNIKWFEYEPTAGNYNTANLQKIVDFCTARNLTLSICFTPYRSEGDGFVPDSDINKTVDGDVWWFEGKDWQLGNRHYIPSMNSDIARVKMRACVKHMSLFLNQFNNTDFIALVTANTEEYQLVRYENPITMTGYSGIDQQKWATFSGGQPVTRPNPTTGETDGFWNWIGSPIGKMWGDFQTEALRDFHTEFVRGVREGGMRTSAFYAGVGAPSGAHNFSTRLDRIYSAGSQDQPDIIYSSEGGSGHMSSKNMATDLNIGTFLGSDYAIEFDPEDLTRNGENGNIPPYNATLFQQDLYTYGSSFFRRGGHIIHMAMAFHPTANIPQLAEALWNLKTQFIDSNSGMTGIEQGEPFVHTFTAYGGQQFRDEWHTRGGGLNKQVKFKIQ